ncbi:MFS transporter [bacterium DOLJORAL78_65_58]|nr:MAG: MFS transporter [bacterium DOLJORAL78_65_58]
MPNPNTSGGASAQPSPPWFMGYSKPFWVANLVELLERAAWYGVFVAITLYLSRIMGYSDAEAALVSGIFSAGMWALPTLMEAAGLVQYGVLDPGNPLADDVGKVILFTGLDTGWQKWAFIPVMLVIMVGGSFIKSVITGTVAKETTEATRAKGYSIFYAMVNVGAFSGKTIVKPLRHSLGNDGFIVLNLFSAAFTLLALILIFFFYKNREKGTSSRTLGEIWASLITVCRRGRLLTLIVIITGFWMVQHQLYASMPKYVLRMAGEGASPSWIANVNPLVVVLAVNLVTWLMAKRTALTSMTWGMFIMPISALAMATGNMFGGELIAINLGFASFQAHPIVIMMIVGIAFQGLAECFISPRFLEYFSLQAPKGEEGLYLGFSHLHSFLSSLFGFVSSGFLLEKFCPDPRTLAPAVQKQLLAAQNGTGPLPEAYAHAHHLWFFFVGIALASAIALVIYGKLVKVD